MGIQSGSFNIYLSLALGLGLLVGCRSAESKRKSALTRLTLHIEANPDASNLTELVTVHTNPLIRFNVQKMPFLTEANVKTAKVVDSVGGFVLSLQFDRQGSWLLENYTGPNRGKHFAVYSQWADAKGELNKGRWLAAPKITAPIKDGFLTFTPEATREDADQIALGLNNVAKKLGTTDKWNF
jgi:hypothetical protein